jgi:hypothetical protein
MIYIVFWDQHWDGTYDQIYYLANDEKGKHKQFFGLN